MRRISCVLLALMILWTWIPALGEEEGLPAYDGPEWTYGVALADIDEDLLMLANSASPLDASYEPSDLRTITARKDDDDGNNLNGGLYLASGGVKMLRKSAFSAVTQLMAAAESDGVTLFLRTGYRSYADQAKLYARAEQRGDVSDTQKAGECDYQTGLAVTLVGRDTRGTSLTTDFASTTEGQWLQKNAARYGFIFRYPQGKEDVTGYGWEPWHLRFVGFAVAEYIQQNNLTLEEFVEELNVAYDEFAAIGGDVEKAMNSVRLPKGAVELEIEGPDGDREITIFHD